MSEQEKKIYKAAWEYVTACDRYQSMNTRDALAKELLRLLKQHLSDFHAKPTD